jgi:hypothetical protein
MSTISLSKFTTWTRRPILRQSKTIRRYLPFFFLTLSLIRQLRCPFRRRSCFSFILFSTKRMEISLGKCPADISTSQRVQRHKEVHSSCHHRRPSDRLFGSPRNKCNCDYATIIQVQLFLRHETLGFISCSLVLIDFNEGLTL